jgi:hypothetical protein
MKEKIKMEVKQCRTNLISDAPSINDKFGPHGKLAQAITDLILNNQEGGKTIGLEGGWGSGKSTVINLLKNSLIENQNILLINFDAWAHQGDPLRRTFLETLISAIKTERSDWIRNDYWDRKLLELANRLKTTTEKNIPKLTTLGKILIVAALFVPFGIPFLAAGLQEKLLFGRGLPIAWEFITGVIFTLAPIWVLIVSSLVNIWKKLQKGRRTRLSPTDTSNNEGLQDDSLIVLLQHTIKETKTETVETVDPTSIEFEKQFVEIMREALGVDDRRMVLVLDNLDRIDSQEALSILSTLQTFLQHKAECDKSWLNRLWVIIPYDRESLQKLWQQTTSDDEKPLAVSFLDKRFQIRFEVPPLVLSDWSKYLHEILKEAFPDHDETEFHLTYRIYALHRKNTEKSPTPRELKIYVNQIGALHRQWQDKFPMPHLGYYVQLKRKGVKVDHALISGEIKDQKPELLLGPNIYENLAAIYFNVEPTSAQQLVLKEPITNALSTGDVDKLSNLSKQPGFEQVLEDIPLSEWVNGESYLLPKAALALDNVGIFQNIDPYVARAVKRSIRDAALSVTTWGTLDKNIGQGIAALVNILDGDAEIIERSIEAATTIDLREGKGADTSKAIYAWIEGMVALLNGLEERVPFEIEKLRGKIPINTSAKGYIEACASLSDKDINGKYWPLIVPQADIEQIATELGELAKTDEFSRRQLSAIRVMKAGEAKIDWGSLITEIGNRLRTNVHYSQQIVGVQLNILWDLNQDDSRALQLIQSLAQQGYLIHHLSGAKNNNEVVAWCILSHASIYPDFSLPNQVGDSENGKTFLNQIFTQPDQYKEITLQFIELLTSTGKRSLLYEILDHSPDSRNWIGTAFTIAAERSDSPNFFPSEEVIKRWEFFYEVLDENTYNALLGKLVEVSDLVDKVISNKFEIKYACLYANIIDNGGVQNDEFTQWCIQNLQQIEMATWKSELEQEGDLLDLIISLVDQSIAINLESPYQDALEDHAKSLLEGKVKVDRLSDCWKSFLFPLPSHRRTNFRSRLINAAKDRDGDIPPVFFELYGEEIIDKNALRGEGVILNLFTSLIRNKNARGIDWLLVVVEKYPDLFADEEQSDIKEFRERVAELLMDQENSSQTQVESIARKLNIHQLDIEQGNSASQA